MQLPWASQSMEQGLPLMVFRMPWTSAAAGCARHTTLKPGTDAVEDALDVWGMAHGHGRARLLRRGELCHRAAAAGITPAVLAAAPRALHMPCKEMTAPPPGQSVRQAQSVVAQSTRVELALQVGVGVWCGCPSELA